MRVFELGSQLQEQRGLQAPFYRLHQHGCGASMYVHEGGLSPSLGRSAFLVVTGHGNRVKMPELMEHWTDSRRGLVLVGEPDTLEALAIRLGLTDDSSVRLAQHRAALALWGEELSTYLVYRQDMTRDTTSTGLNPN